MNGHWCLGPTLVGDAKSGNAKRMRLLPYVSANEVRCSEAEPGKYHLYRLFAFRRQPRLYVLHGALPTRCRLEPVQYGATL